jgi:hypothetical protein
MEALMSTNVTLRMDEKLIQKIKHRAVDDRMSLSAWIATVLRRTVETERSSTSVCERAIGRLERGYSLGGKPLSREEAHVH